VTVTLAAEAVLYLVMLAGFRPWTISLDWHVFHAHHPLQFYVPWLLLLPLLGAASACWSRREGGTPREAALAAMFPSTVALGLIVVSTPLDVVVDVVIQRSHTLEHTFCGTAWGLVSFVLAPGLALGCGLLVAVVWWHHTPRAGRVGGPGQSRPGVTA
jgi:hypothetical protein